MTFTKKKDYLDYLRNRNIFLQRPKSWFENLHDYFGPQYQIIKPRMPLQDNAKYSDWKIHFERHIPLLQDNVIFVGLSLGGVFLAKYLSEHTFPKKILATYLIAPPYDNTLTGYKLVGGFTLPSNLSLLEKNSKHLYLLFSKDDDVIPISHIQKYRAKLKTVNIIVYEDKNGHFKIPQFPQLAEMIKEDVKRMKHSARK